MFRKKSLLPCDKEEAEERGKGMSDYLSWAAFAPATLP